MILYEITGSEAHPLYQSLEISNGNRQYDFLRSIVDISLGADRAFLSQTIIKALNFQAITCLHPYAGEFRPCDVVVGEYHPPQHFRVQSLMDDFVNTVNQVWERSNPIVLSAYVLWRLNHIHPFINGNGRTARAACYYVLCVKAGGLLSGEPILPELLRQNRPKYVEALKQVDESLKTGTLELQPLHDLIAELVSQQLDSVPDEPATE